MTRADLVRLLQAIRLPGRVIAMAREASLKSMVKIAGLAATIGKPESLRSAAGVLASGIGGGRVGSSAVARQIFGNGGVKHTKLLAFHAAFSLDQRQLPARLIDASQSDIALAQIGSCAGVIGSQRKRLVIVAKRGIDPAELAVSKAEIVEDIGIIGPLERIEGGDCLLISTGMNQHRGDDEVRVGTAPVSSRKPAGQLAGLAHANRLVGLRIDADFPTIGAVQGGVEAACSA